MMQRSIRQPLSYLAYLLLVGLSIVSCSNGSGTPSTSSPTNVGTLKVAQNTNASCFFPLYVAEQENFFKAQGLTLDPSIPPPLGNGTQVDGGK